MAFNIVKPNYPSVQRLTRCGRGFLIRPRIISKRLVYIVEPHIKDPPKLSVRPAELASRSRRSRIDKVIVEANRKLADPDAYDSSSLFPELASLNRLDLDDNPSFLFLKRKLEEFYEEKRTRQERLHVEKSRKWKEALYSSLLKALTELTFTEERNLQELYIQRISHWYMEKTQTSLPSIKHYSRTTTPVKTVTAAHFNSDPYTDKSRLDRFLLRKMDAVQSIESRSLSRSVSPVIPRTVKAFLGLPPDPPSYQAGKHTQRGMNAQERRRKEVRAATHYHMLMRRWSSARARLDEAMLQKSERKAIKPQVMFEDSDNSVYDPRETTAYEEKPATPFVMSFVEDKEEQGGTSVTNSQSRVDRLRYQYRNLVPESRESSESPSLISMSAYSRASNTGGRNSPEVLAPHQAKQLAQINSIRTKLASCKVSCAFDVLTSGLLRPADLPQARLSPDFLPTGGEYFTSNPFSSLGRKRKKTSKKGKTRKKS